MTHHRPAAIAAALLAPLLGLAAAEVNLLVNPGFTGGHTGGWTDRTSKKQRVSAGPAEGLPQGGNALRVDIVQDGGSTHGQLIQTVNVRPGTAYRVSAMVKAGRPESAYVQVKQMKGKTEGERISTATNQKADAWEKVEKEITTAADTTALQVLLRFRMNERMVGSPVFFAAPSLIALDGGDPAPKAFEPPKPVEPLHAEPGRDAYVTPGGAGRRDGTDWANAFAASDGGLQRAWDMAGAGNTVHLAAGDYGRATLIMATGGNKGKPKRLAGVEKDGRRPVFKGDWSHTKPSSGPTFIQLKPGVSFVEIENIELRAYKGVLHASGPNTGLRVRNVDAAECRDAFWIDGGATAVFPDNGSHDLVFEDCEVVRYTKRAMRIQNGVHDMTVKNFLADAGGKEYAHEVFPVGFHVLGNSSSKIPGLVDHHITFINCEANNNWHQGDDKYWNADGFAAERNTSDLTFINCRAFGNTDGGWDVKSKRAKWVDCLAVANKRNYRVWSNSEADQPVYENCLSAYSIDYGEKRHDVGFWFQGGGYGRMVNCTAWEDRVPVSVEAKAGMPPFHLDMENCLLATLRPEGTGVRLDGEVNVSDKGTLMKKDGVLPFTLKAPARMLKPVGDAFDCISNPGLGYKGK